MSAYESGLVELGRDTHAFLRPPGTWGWSNSGLIVSGGEALLIDTAYTVALTAEMLDQIAARYPAVHIGKCVFTHGNGDHTFGSPLLKGTELIAAAGCADALGHEVDPAAMNHISAHGPEPLRSYMIEHFGDFDFTDAALPAIDSTFSGRTTLHVGDREVELIEVGPAHSVGDVAVHVPDADVVYAGDIVFAHDTPIAWASARGIVRACSALEETGAGLVVPGHGPVVGRDYLATARGYFEHVLECAERLGQAGVEYQEAAASVPLERYADWRLPERIVISMAAAYGDLGLPAGDILHVLDQMARFASA